VRVREHSDQQVTVLLDLFSIQISYPQNANELEGIKRNLMSVLARLVICVISPALCIILSRNNRISDDEGLLIIEINVLNNVGRCMHSRTKIKATELEKNLFIGRERKREKREKKENIYTYLCRKTSNRI
jgi:hypothetical protein